MKNLKIKSRLRRAKKTRGKQRSLMTIRLSVRRTGKHIYAQIIKPGITAVTGQSDEVIASASTLDTELRKSIEQSSNKDAASQVGLLIAKKKKKKKKKK